MFILYVTSSNYKYTLCPFRQLYIIEEYCGSGTRTSDPQSTEPGFEACAGVSNHGQVCSANVALVHSAV